MRCIGRHTQGEDVVLKAEVSEFSRVVATIAIKNQQPPFASTMLCAFVEVLDQFEAQLVVGPSIVTNSDSPSCWDPSLVPDHLMKLLAKIMKGGIAQPFALIVSIAVTHELAGIDASKLWIAFNEVGDPVLADCLRLRRLLASGYYIGHFFNNASLGMESLFRLLENLLDKKLIFTSAKFSRLCTGLRV